MPSPCRIAACPAPATHVVVTTPPSWRRAAVRATEAPPIQLRDTGPGSSGPPTPYYCQSHAEEKSAVTPGRHIRT